MTSVLCVRNLEYTLSYAEVFTEFEKMGAIKRLYLSRPTSPKLENSGYAFIDYESKESVDAAMIHYKKRENRHLAGREVCLHYGYNYPSDIRPPPGWDLGQVHNRKRPRSATDLDVLQEAEDLVVSLLPPPQKIPRLDEMPPPPVLQKGQQVSGVLNNLAGLTMDEVLTLPPHVRDIVFALCAAWRASAYL